MAIFMSILITSCSPMNKANFTFISFNTWNEGTEVTNGKQITLEFLLKEHPDFIYLTEIINKDYVEKLFQQLNQSLDKKYQYYGYYFSRVGEIGFISRYPIEDSVSRDYFSGENLQQIKKTGSWVEGNNVIRMTVKVGEKKLDIYGVQLDYQYYVPSLPRGYSDHEVNGRVIKLDKVVTSTKYLQQRNLLSLRTQFMQQLILDSIKRGNPTIIVGDFNEPACTDWTYATKNNYAHHGVVYCWDTTKLLISNSFTDSYRKIYQDPVSSPGISWPVYYKDKNTSEIAADQEDRLDYIFTNTAINIDDAKMLGPDVHNDGNKMVRTPHESTDYYNPTQNWSSDHNAMWLKFGFWH